MKFSQIKVLLDGQEVCVGTEAMTSAFNVVATGLSFNGPQAEAFKASLSAGDKHPVIAYLGDGREKVAGEAFMHEHTPDRLHIGVFRTYVLNASTGRWES
jgi:hypothetical protein